jgi:site-specific recombinase XerD
MLRGFAAYWKTIDPRTEIPSLHILLPQYKRPTPHIYTDQQITQILVATRKLPSKDSYTYWTLFGLLLATGMRIGEALTLDNKDVDLKQGVITVRDTKLNKSRILPLHKTTSQVLKRYVQQRNKRFPIRKNKSFFAIVDGRRPSHAVVWKMFKQVLLSTGISEPSQKRVPRLHELLHYAE